MWPASGGGVIIREQFTNLEVDIEDPLIILTVVEEENLDADVEVICNEMELSVDIIYEELEVSVTVDGDLEVCVDIEPSEGEC